MMVVWNGNLKEKMGPFEGNGWKSLLLELTLSYYWPPFYGENLPLDDWVTTGLKPSWERVRSTLRNEATWRLDIDKLSTCKPTQQDIFSFHFIRNSFQKRQNMLRIKADFQNSSESKKCYLLQSLVLITHKSVMCLSWKTSRPSLAKSPKSE